MAPRSTASRPNGGRHSIFTFDGDLVSRCELFDEEDLDAAIARFDQLGQPAAATGERGVARIRKRMVALCGPGLGCLGRARGRQLFGDRSPKGRESRESTWSRCCGQRFASGRRRRLHDIDGERHRNPRRASRPRTCSRLRPRSQGDSKRCPQRRRDRRGGEDRSGRYVRPRRLRRGYCRARIPLYHRRSRRLRAHVVPRRSWLCRFQPARAFSDYARLGKH